jgi:hypothetical protein
MTFDNVQRQESGPDEGSTEHDAQFAYHIERVARSFKYEISLENAEFLVELLGGT